jgi:uncharacterized protein YndB with AHSA1/START domain
VAVRDPGPAEQFFFDEVSSRSELVRQRPEAASCRMAAPMEDSVMKSIEQVVTFRATPAEVFEALIDSKKHAAFTGEPAEIDPKVGGAASFYGGKVTGINLDVVKNERIVQAWRPGNFPPGVFTLVTYAFAPEGKGTKLTFTQQAVPESAYEHLSKGWEERYWQPLRAFLEKDAR